LSTASHFRSHYHRWNHESCLEHGK
jgi:hypothetical protein